MSNLNAEINNLVKSQLNNNSCSTTSEARRNIVSQLMKQDIEEGIEKGRADMHIYCTLDKKNKYVRFAQSKGLKLSKWVTGVLDKEISK